MPDLQAGVPVEIDGEQFAEAVRRVTNSRFTASDYASIAALIRDNAIRLDGCQKPHAFERVGAGRHRCTRCKGEIGSRDFAWYARGLRDGRIG